MLTQVPLKSVEKENKTKLNNNNTVEVTAKMAAPNLALQWQVH